MLGKKQRSLCSFVLFLTTFLFLFHYVSDIFGQKIGGASWRIRSFYREERNSLDVICIGSSHAYCSFVPTVLWEEYGLTSHCLASPKQTVGCAYALMEEALKYQRPEVILLETYYFRSSRRYFSDIRLQEFSDNLRLGIGKKIVFEQFLQETSWQEKVEWLVPFIRYHSRWRNLKESDFHYSRYRHGAKLSKKINSKIQEPLPETGSMTVFEENLDYLKKMIELCEQKNVRLVLYQSPIGKKVDGELPDIHSQSIQIANYLREYLDPMGIPVLIGQEMHGVFDYGEDFRNSDHMNIYGGIKMTKVLGDYLIDKMGLQSHFGEHGYEKWEQDAREFNLWAYGDKEDDIGEEDDGEQG